MIINGEVNEREVEGIRVYTVPAPMEGEAVDGYTNFSDCFGEQTPTELSLIEDNEDYWNQFAAAFPPNPNNPEGGFEI
jgi:hypothetical protein